MAKKINVTNNYLSFRKKDSGNSNNEFKTTRKKSIEKEGWYKGTVSSIKNVAGTTAVTFSISDLNDASVKYKSATAWMPDEYDEGDLTDTFFSVFDNPKTFSDVIGKTCDVLIEMYTNRNDITYPIVVDMDKTDDNESN